MLPPSLQNNIHAEGVPRLRFDLDDFRFELKGVRCGLPTIRPKSGNIATQWATRPCYRKLIKPKSDFASPTVHATKVLQSLTSGGLPRLKDGKVVGVADEDTPEED
jgi:hypothetical protein